MATIHDRKTLEEQMALTSPDYVMFVPRQTEGESDNVHLYVVEHEGYGGLLAFWTQSTVEGTGNNHLVMAGSRDGGKSWTSPRFLLGSRTLQRSPEAQASWGFPIVTRSGRIYLFYYRDIPGEVDNSRQLTATFACIYSDDCGESWSESRDIHTAKTKYDRKADIQDNIVYQLPLRSPDGRYLAGFTKYVTRDADASLRDSTRVYFYRFENIDDDPEAEDMKITILPEGDEEGIFITYPDGSPARIEEPAWLTLPDGRIFCSMRTNLGAVYYSVSDDCGVTWRTPQPLLFSDNSPFVHPLSPCPIFDLKDGRYMQLYHGAFRTDNFWRPRTPLRRAFGHFDPHAKQPIVFDKADDELYMTLPPEKASTLGYGLELAIYGTMTHQKGKNILWYPDRKFFLLGKDVE